MMTKMLLKIQKCSIPLLLEMIKLLLRQENKWNYLKMNMKLFKMKTKINNKNSKQMNKIRSKKRMKIKII